MTPMCDARFLKRDMCEVKYPWQDPVFGFETILLSLWMVDADELKLPVKGCEDLARLTDKLRFE